MLVALVLFPVTQVKMSALKKALSRFLIFVQKDLITFVPRTLGLMYGQKFKGGATVREKKNLSLLLISCATLL